MLEKTERKICETLMGGKMEIINPSIVSTFLIGFAGFVLVMMLSKVIGIIFRKIATKLSGDSPPFGDIKIGFAIMGGLALLTCLLIILGAIIIQIVNEFL